MSPMESPVLWTRNGTMNRARSAELPPGANLMRFNEPSRSLALRFMERLVILAVWGLAGLVCAPPASGATVLQSFDHLFQGDDPSEVFQFNLNYDPAAPTTVRFKGFVENLDPFYETGARFLFAWGRSDGSWDGAALFPDGSGNLVGIRFPAADTVQGPVRVPLDFQARLEYAPAWLRFDVEGLGCCDNFRLVGPLTIEPTVEPQLRIFHLSTTAARITWSTNFAGFTLEYATNLSPTNWVAATNSVSPVDTTFTVTVQTDERFRAFRL